MTSVVVIVGPTASGKSALAVDIAGGMGGEVVNADAMQLYRGMDIGTAKATPSERGGVPHHLIDVLDVTEPASVAAFQRAARTAIADCHDRGVTPVLTGGSSLYVRAVLDQLEFPGTDPDVRARWVAELDRVGTEALHAELARRDPAAAEQILSSNGRRIVRALEVIELTGQPFVATMPPHESIYPHLTMIGLQVPRPDLDKRLADRVEQMWAAGLLDEVRALRQVGLDDGPTASRAIGYSQAIAQLDGAMTEADAKADTVRVTKKFARRQDRLFHADPRVHWVRSQPDSP
ncbi:tRNA (adenosine(37)-N6)-dimethylallyltransferase MiaA [Aeromicrobium sp. CF3.5]|uniref:tRNA (adenosine(37)-N6)-dimethylallyltransferase MiaA n=1 Tax=Aeromicrobium sp. CF3.5 TaxID=3373078 RepID=UPI003EE532B7